MIVFIFPERTFVNGTAKRCYNKRTIVCIGPVCCIHNMHKCFHVTSNK